MVRLTGPLDVPYVQLRETRRAIAPTVDQTGAQNAAAGRATTAILNHVRDQQIENQVVDAELRTRRALDDLRTQIETEPLEDTKRTGPGGQPRTYDQRWQEQADAIVAEHGARLTSPLARRAWEQRVQNTLLEERRGIVQLGQRRALENARAGLIDSIGSAQRTVTDENATPEARRLAMEAIETSVRRAVQRRTIGADDGARMLGAARGAALEFEQNRGMRALAQSETDRIWAESGGNVAVALEMARELEGTIEDDVSARLRQRSNDTQAARGLALDGAMGRAYASIEQNGTVDRISASDRAVIVREGQMDTLRAYRDNRLGGGGVEGQARVSNQRRELLLVMADEEETAAAFAELDMYAPLDEETARALGLAPGQSVAAQVQPDDLRALRTRQRQMLGQAPVGENTTLGQRAYTMLWNYAAPVARAQGIGLSGRQEDADNVRRLRGFLHREAREFVEVNRRLPNQREMQEIATLALTEARTPGVLGIGRSERRVFESREGADVRVSYDRIPLYQRQRLARLYVQAGNELPESEAAARTLIEDLYMQALLGDSE